MEGLVLLLIHKLTSMLIIVSHCLAQQSLKCYHLIATPFCLDQSQELLSTFVSVKSFAARSLEGQEEADSILFSCLLTYYKHPNI